MSLIDEQQDKFLEELRNENKTHVTWTIFIWAIGLLMIVVGWTFLAQAQQNTKIDVANKDVQDVKGDIKEIKTNILWIKDELNQQRNIRTNTNKQIVK